jgi:multisubunit Na+/H+ antiporter MnhB subunit
MALLIITGAFVIFDRLVSLENMVFPYKNSYETFWLLKLSFVGGIGLLGILIARLSNEVRGSSRQQSESQNDSVKIIYLEQRKNRLRHVISLLRNLNVVLGIFVLLWAAVLQNIFGLLILR